MFCIFVLSSSGIFGGSFECVSGGVASLLSLFRPCCTGSDDRFPEIYGDASNGRGEGRRRRRQFPDCTYPQAGLEVLVEFLRFPKSVDKIYIPF